MSVVCICPFCWQCWVMYGSKRDKLEFNFWQLALVPFLAIWELPTLTLPLCQYFYQGLGAFSCVWWGFISLCPQAAQKVAQSFLPSPSKVQGWRNMSGENLPWSQGWSAWFSEGMVWINHVLLLGIFKHEIHAYAFTSMNYSLLNGWAHKRNN